MEDNAEPINHPYLKFYKDKKEEYRWHITGKNGNILSDSGEGYTTFGHAIRGYHDNTKKVLISCGIIEGKVLTYIMSLVYNLELNAIHPKGEHDTIYIPIRDIIV